jgi:predicted metal-dependent peptidase
MCSLGFEWDTTCQTAWTDFKRIGWSPAYFTKLPPASRRTDLLHELWHVARLHGVRRGNRDARLWNISCDIKIDLSLEAEGCTFEGIEGVLTMKQLDARKYNKPRIDAQGKHHVWTEEDIYDDLVQNNPPPPPSQMPANFKLDIKGPTDKASMQQAVNAVIAAMHMAKMGGRAGTIPGDIELIISKFLTPVVPWETLVHAWMTELVEGGYSWRHRNRRFRTSYLPSTFEDEGKLAHLRYYEDVSGSITDADCVRFNSEVKYVKDIFNPKKLTLVQFDTRITQIREFDENDPFEQITVIGRGGTCLRCVRDDIIKHEPTAAIIFSDLQVPPMEPLPFDIPILWVCISNRKAQVPFGKLIHIK